MIRSGFKRPLIERTRTVHKPIPVDQRRGSMAMVGGEPAEVLPKLAPVKAGKRTPTKQEAAWMDAITALGCIACLIDGFPGTPGAVHHLLRGGLRIGHLHSICLCDPGHHQNGAPLGKVSRHPWKARFEERYGTEEELLALTKLKLNHTGRL